MNSANASQMPLTILSEPTPTSQSPEVVIEIPGRLPSWNDVLGMEEWARYRFKQQVQETFLCALRLSATDSSMKTTSAKNTMSIAADTLALYMTTARQQRALKSAKKKLEAKNVSLSRSKSFDETTDVKGPLPF